MARDEKDVPVRIVKKKGGHGGHHGGAWKVAYADFVTAMMALFIVLWILAQSQEVKEGIASYFKDPGVFETTKGGVTAGGQPTASGPPAVTDFHAQQKAMMEQMAKAIRETMTKRPEFKDLEKQVKIEVVKEGLRFELLETPDSVFFDIGTANLKPDKAKVLALITHQIRQMPNDVVIEGHTDSRPYPSLQGYTNFELSADRANSARRVMMAEGLLPNQVKEVRGYADSKLRDTNDPYSAVNRRISILLRFMDAPPSAAKQLATPAANSAPVPPAGEKQGKE